MKSLLHTHHVKNMHKTSREHYPCCLSLTNRNMPHNGGTLLSCIDIMATVTSQIFTHQCAGFADSCFILFTSGCPDCAFAGFSTPVTDCSVWGCRVIMDICREVTFSVDTFFRSWHAGKSRIWPSLQNMPQPRKSKSRALCIQISVEWIRTH